ncbi:MAG: YqgE/AlgH family protein [Gammaproteobacteria bacterium]
MASGTYFTDQFLIAMPNMSDPRFQQTVTYVCEHDEDGALGIVINRPLELKLGEVLAQMSLDTSDDDLCKQPIVYGGPVQQDRGFVLHDPTVSWDSTLSVSPDVGLTTSRDILASMAGGDGPTPALVALGYAGWDAGQLDREMASNAWLSVPANTDIIFRTPFEKRWEAAVALLGIDLDRLSDQAGHA